MYRNHFSKIIGFALMILLISGFTLLQNQSGTFSKPVDPVSEYEEYEKQWKKVDSLINKGLPKSALEITESIYLDSKESTNYPQFIKAILFKMKLSADYEEEFMENAIADLLEEIETAEEPANQVLHSILAETYWRYFQSNRYKFYNRTTIASNEPDDIQTWDLNTLLDHISLHYNTSLKNPEILKTTNLKDFTSILEESDNSKIFRPSLYDFLAHRAIDFFMHDESSITQPAFRFELNKKTDFGSASEFISNEYKTQDTRSLKYQALLIFQELTRYHVEDKDPVALIDLDLKRLDYVWQNSILSGKDSLYIESLKKMESTFTDYPSSTEVSFQLAEMLYAQGSKYNSLVSEDYKWEVKNAIDVCEEAINRFPDSAGAKKCAQLLSRMKAFDFSMTVEKENIPGKPFLSLLKYKNLNSLYFRIVKVDYSEHRNMVRDNKGKHELLAKYITLTPDQEWNIEIPTNGDYQSHKAEIEMPALEAGHYLLLGSQNENFTIDSNAVSYQTFWITSIGFISQNNPDGSYGFYLLDRSHGSPLKDIEVKLFYREYDYKSRTYNYNEGGNYVSNNSGYFEIPPLSKGGKPKSFFLELKSKNDHFVTGDRFYHSGASMRKVKTREKVFMFTDRAIYRPGQTVYFKGIVFDKTGPKYVLKEDHSVQVEFKDVNHQNISELSLKSNDFGSFQGSFIIPTGLLNGRMTLKTKKGSVSFQVEDYKRPNFEVTFMPIEGNYKINEEIEVKGNAKAFAGNDISDAKVQYRVVREVYYPWRYNYRRYFPMGNNMEISNGATTTDENGEFKVLFTAIPDYSVSQKFQPAFRYTIHVSVSDVNNETQTAVSSVNVGYQAMKIELDVGEVESRKEFTTIPIAISNLNGQKIPAKAHVEIVHLAEPRRLLRAQLWQHPDVFLLDSAYFTSRFPHDSYNKENLPENLSVKASVFNQDFDSETDSILFVGGAEKWEPGRYRIEVKSRDVYGTEVKAEKYFILHDPGMKSPPIYEINWFHALKTTCEPGEMASFVIGSADKKVRVLYEVVHKEKVIKSEWMTLSNEQVQIEIPVTEEYRGGFKVNLLFVKHNRVYKNNFGVHVPYTNKKLDFEFITFRDKLQPGQDEEWKIRINGKTGDSIAAELLAGMYDASLDKFSPHKWSFNIFTFPYHGRSWNTENAFESTSSSRWLTDKQHYPIPKSQTYDQLNWFGFNYMGRYDYFRGIETTAYNMKAMPGNAMVDGLEVTESEIAMDEMGEDLLAEEGDSLTSGSQSDEEKISESAYQVRRDFRETAFFYPQLRTDENGDVLISFKAPESLTTWKLMGLAMTRDLKVGSFTREIATQKELMVVPNAPRFFRENDELFFTAKVVNLSEKSISGKVTLKFIHTLTAEDITAEVLAGDQTKEFTVEAGQSIGMEWVLGIPVDYSLISYQIVADGGSHADGEEKPIPVVSNRMLVTESLPMPLNAKEMKTFTLKKLVNSQSDGSLKHHKLTLEFSSNPAWYAVQAIPYIMDGGTESADQIFYRFYANSIASYIVDNNPKLKAVFDAWSTLSSDALLSNLEKNQDLKSLILEETPWVRNAQSESERKRRIALLFDFNKMSQDQEQALYQLARKQSPGGGWAWYKGMPDNRNITQRIVTGFGHLKQLGVFDAFDHQRTKSMMTKAIRYLDSEIQEDYEWLIGHKVDLNSKHIGNIQIQYLYARTYFLNDVDISNKIQTAFDFYVGQSEEFWVKQGLYQKAMISLTLNRLEKEKVPGEIMASIKEYALYSEEMGMYWRDNSGGYYWHQAPIETQAILIEAFNEVMDDQESVGKMKIWLLKQKQTQDWKTTRATADAVYALLMRGADWLENDELVEITIGGESFDPTAQDDTKIEAGTGYFRTSWIKKEISPEMGEVTVSNKNDGIAWGALYWQYFEDLDKITFAETPLKIQKELFVKVNTDTGPVLKTLEDKNPEIGDVVIVRIELRVDRAMEYVHMKDQRASCFEPVNVISGYRYQGGLGYYESTRDASTNFFFDYLNKGTYVFEYPLVVSQQGDFSNGITTIQCMYAPEFTSHSKGVRVLVK